GYIASLDAERLGIAATRLGAGRSRAEDQVDHAVGIELLRVQGDPVRQGEPILKIDYRRPDALLECQRWLDGAIRISDEPPVTPSLVLEEFS
ncbi:MAG: hypothetical protein ACRCZF_01195, partial [Gemmataceae bacterium]